MAYPALLILLILGAFLTVLLWPTKSEIAAAKTEKYRVEVATANNNIFSAALPELAPVRLQNALRALDQVSYKHTETALSRSRNQTHAMTLLVNEIGSAIERNRAEIAQAPVHHFDQILNSLKAELRSASKRNAQWCAGDTFGNFADNQPRPDLGGSLVAQFVNTTPELSQYLLDLSTMILEAGVDGAKNGVGHGALTAHDKAVLEGVMVSIFSDPQILKMMVAINPDSANEAALAKFDVCAIGVSAITALSTMPQGTKGRVWAEIVSGNRDVSRLGLRP